MFSSVDASDDPARAIWYLDQTRRAESGMKHYAKATHAMCAPEGFVVDVGCGVGHDLELLADADLQPVGVDPSAVLLAVARERGGRSDPLVQAIGEALPFRDESIAGAHIERVLQHVALPVVVLDEVLDRVEELSVWRSLDVLDGTIGLERSIAHAVENGRVSRPEADHWLQEQQALDAVGQFYASMRKVMVVATRR